MVSNPRKGDAVMVRYKKSLKSWFPLEGKAGVIKIVCKARRCRNHGVEIEGQMYVIPCGNLFYLPASTVCCQCHQPSLGGLFYIGDEQLCGECAYNYA